MLSMMALKQRRPLLSVKHALTHVPHMEPLYCGALRATVVYPEGTSVLVQEPLLPAPP